MKPLIRPPTPEEVEEARGRAERKRNNEAWLRCRASIPLLRDTPVATRTDWSKVMRPLGAPNPRDALIEDFKALREAFEPPVPPDQRDGYGPPPSNPRDRLYEHLKRKGLLGLGASLQGLHDQTQTLSRTKGEQEGGAL